MSPSSSVAHERSAVEIVADVDDLPVDSLDAFNDTWTAGPIRKATSEMNTVSELQGAELF